LAKFVLVHGSWHGGWCWERLVPLLAARGHDAIAPDLAGMGADKTPLSEVDLARWADDVVALIESEPEPVVLVGHSRGGIVISEVAERVPQKLRKLVYLAAWLVPDGATLLEAAGEVGRDASATLLVMSADGTSSTIVPEAIGPVFYNTTPKDLLEHATGMLVSEPMSVFVTPLRLTAERFGRVPRAYIETVYDNAVPLALQRAMQAALPCNPVVTLDTDHSPFYSAPGALADALDYIARD